MDLLFTQNNNYIKITNMGDYQNNIGIISPIDGQLSVKPELYKILEESGLAIHFEWIDGPGRHGGVNDYRHTNHFASLFHVLVFFKGLAIQLDEQIDFHLI